MFDFRVSLIRQALGAHHDDYVPAYHSLALILRGHETLSIDGCRAPTDSPCFALFAKGQRVLCDRPSDYECWGVIVQTDAWRKSRRKGMVDIRFRDVWTTLAQFTPLTPEETQKWRQELAMMRQWFSNPIPLNHVRLALGVLSILHRILYSTDGVVPVHSPASRLKAMLDNPLSRSRSLQSLSSEEGYSPEHLRKRFREEFGMSPVVYRSQIRMAEAMDLVASSRLSIKEISYRVGFKEVSHFSHAFRKMYGLSPKQAVARYRDRHRSRD